MKETGNRTRDCNGQGPHENPDDQVRAEHCSGITRTKHLASDERSRKTLILDEARQGDVDRRLSHDAEICGDEQRGEHQRESQATALLS